MKLTKLSSLRDDKGNKLEATGTVQFDKSFILFSGANCSASISGDSDLRDCQIELVNNSTLTIGPGCRIRGRITVGAYSTIGIGCGLSVTKNVHLRAVESTALTIGDDCLFASNNVVRTSDGHPIYDAATRKRLNPSRSIVIGDHVWLADDVAVLKGGDIGSATAVAMRSVVTKPLPPNTICAGIPARVIKSNVVWEHRPGVFSEQFYSTENDEDAR